MSSNTLFIIILIVFTADFIFERYISFLNIKSSKNSIPAPLADIYDAEKYAKQQKYFRANSRYGMFTSAFGFFVMLLMLLLGGFGWLDGIIRSFNLTELSNTLIFFGVLFFANEILTMPFEIYDIFVIEQRFGFNRVTPKIFVLDKLKTCLLAVIIGGGLVSLIVWIYQLAPDCFWLLAFGAISLFALCAGFLYSDIIVPLFNKQTPLPAGELRDEIELFSKKAGFELKNIYVIDGSKRSTKANAYFTGFGSRKRIVLYDTLIEKMSVKEIVAVLSHEIGHYKRRHTLKGLAIALPANLLLFILLGIILKSRIFAEALGSEPSFYINILSFAILYSPFSTLIDVLQNILTRKFEYQADNFSKSHNLGNELVSALKKLSANSLSNLTPHPLAVFVRYSHPTLEQRIENLERN
ncbi:MAG: M48 family metallopeptidase [Prevotellaceae bacterium]|jgi:STE24 endopeptidase|nr:M48 family metallopeptidase [Prevotellaceae bacterium]